MQDPDEQLQRRLRDELDPVRPLYSTPRYLAVRPRPLAWRLAPALVASAFLVALAFVAYSQGPNATVWTEHVVTVIHPPAPSPIATPANSQATPQANQPSAAPPTHHESPEPQESPEPRESPEPTDNHSGGDHTSDSGDTERS